jgi:hypothetical protein
MKLLPFLVLALSTMPAVAQTSFLGVSLDAPFPGSMLACPKMKDYDMVDSKAVKTVGTCFVMEASNKYYVMNGPQIGIGRTFTVETQGGKPLWFRLRFSKEQYLLAVEIFTTKFGKAQKSGSEKIYTRAGEVFDSRTHSWSGARLRIELNEVGRDVRWSDGSILNVALSNELERQMKLEAKAAAENL